MHFLLGNFLNLSFCEFAYLGRVGCATTLLFADGLQYEGGRGRSFEYKVERTIFVHSNLGWDGLASHIFGGLVEALYELADVDTRLTKGGANRRCRSCRTTGSQNLESLYNFLCHFGLMLECFNLQFENNDSMTQCLKIYSFCSLFANCTLVHCSFRVRFS